MAGPRPALRICAPGLTWAGLLSKSSWSATCSRSAAGSLLCGHTMLLAVALLLFVAAVAVAAPAVVETVNTIAPHARGAAVALYACSMFIGASLGPQLTGALAGQAIEVAAHADRSSGFHG